MYRCVPKIASPEARSKGAIALTVTVVYLKSPRRRREQIIIICSFEHDPHGGQEAPEGRPYVILRGGRGSQRAQEGLKGVPQSELDDSYTVSEGPEGGLKGKNLQKPRVFEHS